jgi:hypothetical protein
MESMLVLDTGIVAFSAIGPRMKAAGTILLLGGNYSPPRHRDR